MRRILGLAALLGILVPAFACGNAAAGPGGQKSSGSNPSAVFITGEDAPLPSVVSFFITINSITLNNSSGSVTVMNTPTTVDFGRLVGLRSLLGFNTVAPGTYTSATFNLSSPVIDYVNLNTNPPSLGTINGSLTNSIVTVALPQPMVAMDNGLAGLHMDFDLRDSLQVDQTGQITGQVDPVIFIKAASMTSADREITDFTGTVVSVDVQGNSFVMQGPWGFQEKINVNLQTLLGPTTQFNGSWTLSSLPVEAIVSVAGEVEPDGSILAYAVEVITTDKAFISGRLLQVNPSGGPVHTITMYIGEELPAMSGNFARGQVVTFDVSAVQTYDVCFINNWLAQFAFDNSSMVAGQRIFVGGTWDNSTTTFTPDLISLRRQGIVGLLVANSVTVNNGTQGSFLLEWVAQGPFTVNTNNATLFFDVNGLAGLSNAGTAPIVAGGLVLKNQNTGLPEVYAHRVAVLP
jgi:hypothetical protein